MMFTMIYSSSRLVYSIGRDGMLPTFLAKLDPHTMVPKNALWVVAVIIAFMGGLVSLDNLTSLVNIGTLLAFTFVSFGIIPLRKRTDIDCASGPTLTIRKASRCRCTRSCQFFPGSPAWP